MSDAITLQFIMVSVLPMLMVNCNAINKTDI